RFWQTWVHRVGPVPPWVKPEELPDKIKLSIDRDTLLGIARELVQKAGSLSPEQLEFEVRIGSEAFAVRPDDPLAPEEALRADEPGKALLTAFVPWLLQTWEQERVRSERMSFDGLLTTLARALQRSPALGEAIARQWPLLFIDECQDTDPTQWQIFEAIYGTPRAVRTAVVMVGDPKQSIYRFRGADLRTFLELRNRPGLRCYTLDVNFRSDPCLLEAVNTLFADEPGKPGALDIDEQHRLPYQPLRPAWHRRAVVRDDEQLRGMNLTYLRDAEAKIPDWLAARIVTLLDGRATVQEEKTENGPVQSRPLRPSDIAILTGTRDQARDIQKVLERAGLPVASAVRDSVFASPEALDWLAAWRALLQQNRETIGALAPTRLVRLSADRMPAALDDLQQRVARLRARYWTIGALTRALLSGELCMANDESASLASLLIREQGGLRVWTNYRHLAALTIETAVRHHWSLPDVVTWLEKRVSRGESDGDDAALLQIDRDDDAIRLMTVHMAKGLEWPVVFCPYLWKSEGLLLHNPAWLLHRGELGSAGRRRFRFGVRARAGRSNKFDPELEQLEKDDEHAEGRRLLYVALTRASSFCEVLVPSCYARRNLRRFRESSPLFALLGRRADMGEAHAAVLNTDVNVEDSIPGLFKAWCERYGQAHTQCRQANPPTAVPHWRRPPLVGQLVAPARIALPQPLVDSHSYSSWAHHGGLDRVAMPGADEEPGAPEVDDRWSAFRPGRVTGLAWHTLLERYLCFPEARSDMERLIRDSLPASLVGDADVAVAQLREGMQRWISTPIVDGEATLRLDQLQPSQVFCEWEICVPLAERTSVGRLLEALATGEDWVARAARTMTGRLDVDRPVAGWIEGVIDLVACSEAGHWWVIDYKSDAVTAAGVPSPAQLQQRMADAGYLIQVALYVTSLRRYLRVRGAGDITIHPVWLFLRSFGAPDIPDAGVCRIPMPPERLDRIEQALFAEREER
ncbi:MAG: hypothetical protein D6761_07520, partial [Candidatus Dadabacteria bacterium]